MTDDDIIAVVSAHKAGKEIQCISRCKGDNWTDQPHPSWNFGDLLYRVKPEPREWFAVLYGQSGIEGGLFATKGEAAMNRSEGEEIIKVRQVPE